MAEPESERGKYLYGIIRCSEPREFTNRGIGENGDLVYTVSAGDLAAVVSDSPEIEYERSRRNMLSHTLVLEEVAQEFTALPVRFGTVAPAQADIATELLDRRHDEFARLLDEMEGRVELGLKAIWYEDVIFAEIVDENPPIRELRDSLKGKSAAETHFGRMRLGEMVQDAMGVKRDGDARAILARLEPLAVKTRENPLFSDRMVLNAAFLVERGNEPDFDRAVDDLDAEMGRRLILKYVGPTPLYNFVSINVTWDRP
jgi:hypothetical protein